MPKIRPESELDSDAIEVLLDAVFGTDRHAKTSYSYRDGVAAVANLSHVAQDIAQDITQDQEDDGGTIVGTIRYWPITIGTEKTPALLLGPIAVEPTRKGEGIGIRLILETLELAATDGVRLVILVGELPYYERFGFESSAAVNITMPNEAPERVQVLFLDKSLKGKVSGVIEKASSR